ncbi:hypothetical protein SAMN05421823_102130 [Catalinimonas alkaloidigena]|uniref:DUF1223 domain-containing protein n=1 Tax=Catalinimonas alkaloidigena TaxID=1075417 RepID=A0A1G8ZYW0_9BACT|nr:DUF1223 domain-containing protein [Catalinimonas alkaloidigena]SDK20273.1 hypothetical protein SAMN05421823_102130 [Catalinimonas alkaloidigena]
MKRWKFGLGSVLVALVATAFVLWRPHASVESNASAPAFALIELFTSEGCSSCPAADRLVARVQEEMAGRPVYFLGYHVDYWNRLGWKDVYSDPAYTQRQRQYTRWLGGSNMYTPQIVVNGQQEFVGSNEAALRSAIRESQQQPASAALDVTAYLTNPRELQLKYRVKTEVISPALWLAFVQREAVSHVGKGENRGKTLTHVTVVRQLSSLPVQATETQVALPTDFSSKAWELLTFLQDATDGKILAVQPVKLEEEEPQK